VNKKNILITGGAGYIGSHTCVALCEAGYTPIIFDNFCNSSASVIQKIEALTKKSLDVVQGDIRDEALLQQALEDHQCEAVIHFAGLKAVGESVAEPLKYYDVNVGGSLTLLRVMEKAKVKKLVFSSSAAVYGAAEELPIKESAPCSPVNPYGRSKFIVEEILADLVQADFSPTFAIQDGDISQYTRPQNDFSNHSCMKHTPHDFKNHFETKPSQNLIHSNSESRANWSITCLRYFNPIGAHPSGLIGERPQGVPSNLMPYLTQAAAGLRQELSIFGDDYPTKDGSAVRDYIHVMDLAEGHIAALREATASGMATLNLGTGKGYSVLEMVAAFEKATGEKVPCKIVPRRAGDVAACWADPTAAEQALGWKATRGLEEMCRDSWKWQVLSSDKTVGSS